MDTHCLNLQNIARLFLIVIIRNVQLSKWGNLDCPISTVPGAILATKVLQLLYGYVSSCPNVVKELISRTNLNRSHKPVQNIISRCSKCITSTIVVTLDCDFTVISFTFAVPLSLGVWTNMISSRPKWKASKSFIPFLKGLSELMEAILLLQNVLSNENTNLYRWSTEVIEILLFDREGVLMKGEVFHSKEACMLQQNLIICFCQRTEMLRCFMNFGLQKFFAIVNYIGALKSKIFDTFSSP